ncbi:cytochrome c-type biogenesis protein [Actibacterium sp. 188UL27-1]|uniref:cytochrome c-type biogenesis protein n=1 Tax=Actibacterium sp. 188UL27-1 TaxID=2786961 RepID=UPI00195945E6|nr:cytochrome c-type biogenesis protein [Actibacterium sp. 188UL27-1]MBM7067660.1 cytochrome c-type biogenesis protein CcmH [Actibacterium sp. 188UL27-1]
MRVLVFLCAMLVASAAWALDPSEMLPDAAQEQRARALDHELRCVQCQSETIASSNADWARDARRAVREQVAAGKTDPEIKAFFVARYGEGVLMTPSTGGMNLILWIAGPVMLLIAGVAGASYIRRRDPAQATEAPLSAGDEARLREILDE